MKDALKRTSIAAAILVLMTSVSLPTEYTLGSLEIRTPWTRETPKGATIGGGYVEIKNNGAVADRLLGGSVSFAKLFEIHQTTMDNGVAKMRQVTTGVEIGPGQTLKFEPGSSHLMFVNLTGPLHAGEKVHGTLQFEHAGTIEIDYAVLGMGAKSPGQEP
ncbi:MAG TPA: copper chaperone PCu(A)C [Steroidobacteraceae bacterium]|nr:copper chaperone PCu(A)C [Steroidobacteraceae bacterium]